MEANVANDGSANSGLSDRPMMKPYRPVPRDWSIIRKIGSESLMTSNMGAHQGLLIKSGRCQRQTRPVPSIAADVEAASVRGLPEPTFAISSD
jgi:hypothetical protein